MAINWNSALAWMASFLADQGDGGAVPAAACTVALHQLRRLAGRTGFTGQVSVTNTGTTAVDGWTLRFAFAGDRGCARRGWRRSTQAGATVTARNESLQPEIHPGATVTFGFNATTGGGANPSPGLVTVNGAPCSLT